MPTPHITVIICTYNRAKSLIETLRYLADNDRTGLEVEAIVVDNNSPDHTRQAVEGFDWNLKVRYVFERNQGKTYALNCGLRQPGLGEIVAFLDDDMAPHKDWFRGIKAICERWPDRDVFSGNSYVVWPSDPPPKWCLSGRVQGWAHSVNRFGTEDRVIVPDHWPVGGHFWIRRRVLDTGIHFDEPLHCDFAPTGHVSDPDFIFQLLACGFKGIAGPDAVTGHRVQPPLTDRAFVMERARVCGRAFQYVRATYPTLMWQAKLLHDKPWLFYMLRLATLGRSYIALAATHAVRDSDERFARQLALTLQLSGYWESIRNFSLIKRKAELNAVKVERLKAAIREKGIPLPSH